MPWNNQTGGGPWKPGPRGPWGQGPSGGNGGGGGGTPPDLEELLRRSQDRLRQAMPGGFSGGRSLIIFGVAAVGLWLASGFYTVGPNEVGLNMVFNKYEKKTSPGLNYNWPAPIGGVNKLQVTDRNSIEVGFSTREDTRRGGNIQTQLDVPEESLMLTGDENIADVKFRVIWQIDPVRPEDFAFNVREPRETVKAVAESVMREIVGRTPIQRILTAERKVIEPAAQELTQKVLNDYKAGVLILQVQLLSVDPPEQVVAAFRDVTAAQQDQDRLRNEAEAYANRVVPEARGDAARIVQESEGYREQTVNEAKGQTARFSQVLKQYTLAPDVTRERIYLETMERVFGGMNKVIVDQNSGSQGVVPYLPLQGLNTPPAPQQPAQGAAR
ncbi:MAG: Protein HflK [Hyphomicrobiales bacterium]|nr:Protein HflK [Hyphomicrobiales bacterium]